MVKQVGDGRWVACIHTKLAATVVRVLRFCPIAAVAAAAAVLCRVESSSKGVDRRFRYPYVPITTWQLHQHGVGEALQQSRTWHLNDLNEILSNNNNNSDGSGTTIVNGGGRRKGLNFLRCRLCTGQCRFTQWYDAGDRPTHFIDSRLLYT